MELIDTHCLLFRDPLVRDVEAVRARAGEAGVREMVVPAHDLVSWDAIREIGRVEGTHPALGLHPAAAGQVATDTARSSSQPPLILRGPRGVPGQRNPLEPADDRGPLPLDEFRDRLAADLQECRAVAVGTIGLDFAYERPAPAAQLAVLRLQLQLAVDLDLPVILYCRYGWELLVAAIQPFAGRIRGVMHDFTRPPELAGPFLRCGFYVGLGGAVTRPQARGACRSAEVLPLNRILLETGAPLTGLDGVDPAHTEPRHLGTMARAVAVIRDTPVEQVAQATTANAREFFRI